MSTKTQKRKQRAAKVKEHIRNFHNSKKPYKVKFLPQVCGAQKPTRYIDDLTDYEVEQIWAEAVYRYKTEGFDPEESEKEIQEMLEQDPLLKSLYERLNRSMDSKSTRRDADPIKAI